MSQWDILCFISLILCSPPALTQGLLGALNGLGNGLINQNQNNNPGLQLNNQVYPGPSPNLLNLASLNLGGNNNPNRLGYQNNQRPNLGGYNTNANQNKGQILADGQKLLEKLQQLNKQKNENNNQNGMNNNANGAGHQNIENNPNGAFNNGVNNNVNKPDKNNQNASNNLNQGANDGEKLNESDANERTKLKSLTKVKFYFQAQPVVPENEVPPRNVTVYFLDFK